MKEQVEQILRKFDKLTAQLADESILHDPKRYKTVAKERADLEKGAAVARELVDTYRTLEDSRAVIAAGDDPEIVEIARSELEELEATCDRLEEELKLLLVPKDPSDHKNTIIEIRAGTGGEEANLFAADLMRMYARFAENKGWKIEVLSSNETGIGGFKEVIFLVQGSDAYGTLKYESGVHRVQRVPVTESSGRIHTSAVTVAVLPEADAVDVQIQPDDLKMDVFRASGAGGQHVNRTESAVRITHLPTGIVVSCQDEKSQHKNRARAMKILQARLFEQAKSEAESERSEERRSQVGSGDRSERIRTYNFPQSRITDHRINLTIHRLSEALQGDLDPMVDALVAHAQAEALGRGGA
jgi:peptide chain release factor 1